MLIHTHVHLPLWTHTRTPYPYYIAPSRDRADTSSWDGQSRHRRLRSRQKNLLPPKAHRQKAWNKFIKMQAPMSSLELWLWYAGDTTLLLTVQPQIGSHMHARRRTWRVKEIDGKPHSKWLNAESVTKIKLKRNLRNIAGKWWPRLIHFLSSVNQGGLEAISSVYSQTITPNNTSSI